MRFIRRLVYWLRLSSHHADLMNEVEFHREMVERDLVRRGMSPADARIEARRTMGNDTMMREESRAVWLWPSLESVWQDATYTLRDLRRNPTFTIGVTLTLALGIGANTAMFSLIDRLLFRPPAFMADPSTVHQVFMYRTSRGRGSTPTRCSSSSSRCATFDSTARQPSRSDSVSSTRRKAFPACHTPRFASRSRSPGCRPIRSVWTASIP